MLVGEFISVMDEEIENLEKAVAERDSEMITHCAHKMKGAAANMMVEDVRKYCGEMQRADKSDAAVLQRIMSSIRVTYGEFRAIFR